MRCIDICTCKNLKIVSISTQLRFQTRSKPMKTLTIRRYRHLRAQAFTLVEMLVVIAIMSILVTAGAVGLTGIGGKGVTSGVSVADSMFDEARTLAVGQRVKSRLLIARNLTNNATENLRKIIIVTEELDDDGNVKPNSWVVSSRGTLLPDKTFFSQDFSKENQESGIGLIPSAPLTGSNITSSYRGEYFYYEFNAEGIISTPGASFIIGNGARPVDGNSKPRVTSDGTRDFGGFVIWRNGRTSVFRNPSQMKIPDTVRNF